METKKWEKHKQEKRKSHVKIFSLRHFTSVGERQKRSQLAEKSNIIALLNEHNPKESMAQSQTAKRL